MNMPSIPKALHDFLRPKDRKLELGIDHNLGDIIPYPTYIILRFYGTCVSSHFLSNYVPKRIGFLEVIWQLGNVENKHLKDQGKGTFFPSYACFYDYLMIKGGWDKINNFLKPLGMRRVEVRTHDSEGSMAWLKMRNRSSNFTHQLNFHKDVIRNIFYVLK